MISTDWFRSDGIKSSLDKKPEMMYTVAGHVRDILNGIEAEAVRQLKVPADLIQQHNLDPASVTSESLYRPLYKSDHLFSKLSPDCSFFNNRRQLIKREELGHGEYRVVLLITGIYIGSHAQSDKLASLHMRISQIQYQPVNITCLLGQMPGLLSGLACPQPSTQSFPQTLQVQQQQQQQTTKKGRRQNKPQLQRQNAMVEVQKAAPTTEVLPNDFFANLDI